MITYRIGDATRPPIVPDEQRYIVHCCNDKGGWGSGFVLAVDKLSPRPRQAYQSLGLHHGLLGTIQVVRVDSYTSVVNLIGQRGTIVDRPHPVRYDAIYNGLLKVAAHVRANGGTIHMPRMGSGLAGGSWDVIEAIVNETCPDLPVFVYDLPTEES